MINSGSFSWCYRLSRLVLLGFKGVCASENSRTVVCAFVLLFSEAPPIRFLQYFGLEKKVELVLLYVSIFVLSSNTRWPTSLPSSSMILTPGPMENLTKSRMER